jgi:CubicO group peptidase (beta-lactamase class C family)
MDDFVEALARLGASHTAGVVVSDGGVVERAGPQEAVFALASVTKLLSGYAVLIAIEEGTVSLEQAAGPPGSTVRHLLAHASGLGTERADGVVAGPGERRIYSNAGFELLAETVSSACGFSFAEYVSEAVFGPLGMSVSTLGDSAARDGRSSAGDLGIFASELLSPRLVDPDTLAVATTVAFPGLAGIVPGYGRMTPCDWGLGFELRDHKSPHWTGTLNSPETFGHFGQSGTFVSIDPVERIGIVALSDRPFGAAARQAWPPLADGVITRHRG